MELNRLLTTIDTHVAGEPLRIITGGLPQIKGNTILEKRAYFREHYDHLRRILMYEPRGHDGMYGCIITPPVSDDSDFGVLFMHNEGFSTMCGHGIICVVTMAIETGMVEQAGGRTEVVIDSPAGKVVAHAECDKGKVLSVTFENVPSFVFQKDVPIQLPEFHFTADIAFGGAFYAIVHAKDLGVKISIEDQENLKAWGWKIKKAIEEKMKVQHPLQPELQGIYGVIISDDPVKDDSDLRNVTIFADKQIDRSPCGTGTCARMAALHARGELAINEKFVHESLIGSQFTGRILIETKVENYPAIIPSITGSAFITGSHQFVVDPEDPLGAGFLLKD